MRKVTLAAMVAIAALAVGIVLVPHSHIGQHHLFFKAYFDDAHDLRAGSEVRLAGVQVGSVRSVEAHPELKDRPAEVVMDLWTQNDLRVPKDALVSVAQEGILGQEYVAIDVTDTTGKAAQSGDTLRTHATEVLTTQQIVDEIKEAAHAAARPETPSRPQPKR